MSKPKSIKESLVTWRTMVANLAPRLDELPYLREQHATLSALVARAEKLEAQQSRYKAKLQKVNQERTDAAREGRRLRNQIAAGLQFALGAESARLIEFGVPPRPTNARRHRPTKAERAQRAAAVGAEGKVPARRGRQGDPSLVN
jgi:hypothetical protein